MSSESMHEGNLRGAFSDHQKANAWQSERGGMIGAYEQPPLESTAGGESRHQAPTHSPDWNTTTIVQTPTTGPESGMYSSSLPNH